MGIDTLEHFLSMLDSNYGRLEDATIDEYLSMGSEFEGEDYIKSLKAEGLIQESVPDGFEEDYSVSDYQKVRDRIAEWS